MTSVPALLSFFFFYTIQAVNTSDDLSGWQRLVPPGCAEATALSRGTQRGGSGAGLALSSRAGAKCGTCTPGFAELGFQISSSLKLPPKLA